MILKQWRETMADGDLGVEEGYGAGSVEGDWGGEGDALAGGASAEFRGELDDSNNPSAGRVLPPPSDKMVDPYPTEAQAFQELATKTIPEAVVNAPKAVIKFGQGFLETTVMPFVNMAKEGVRDTLKNPINALPFAKQMFEGTEEWNRSAPERQAIMASADPVGTYKTEVGKRWDMVKAQGGQALDTWKQGLAENQNGERAQAAGQLVGMLFGAKMVKGALSNKHWGVTYEPLPMGAAPQTAKAATGVGGAARPALAAGEELIKDAVTGKMRPNSPAPWEAPTQAASSASGGFTMPDFGALAQRAQAQVNKTAAQVKSQAQGAMQGLSQLTPQESALTQASRAVTGAKTPLQQVGALWQGAQHGAQSFMANPQAAVQHAWNETAQGAQNLINALTGGGNPPNGSTPALATANAGADGGAGNEGSAIGDLSRPLGTANDNSGINQVTHMASQGSGGGGGVGGRGRGEGAIIYSDGSTAKITPNDPRINSSSWLKTLGLSQEKLRSNPAYYISSLTRYDYFTFQRDVSDAILPQIKSRVNDDIEAHFIDVIGRPDTMEDFFSALSPQDRAVFAREWVQHLIKDIKRNHTSP
jgi:hypothetical protein